jgi:hypothetical protein
LAGKKFAQNEERQKFAQKEERILEAAQGAASE